MGGTLTRYSAGARKSLHLHHKISLEDTDRGSLSSLPGVEVCGCLYDINTTAFIFNPKSCTTEKRNLYPTPVVTLIIRVEMAIKSEKDTVFHKVNGIIRMPTIDWGCLKIFKSDSLPMNLCVGVHKIYAILHHDSPLESDIKLYAKINKEKMRLVTHISGDSVPPLSVQKDINLFVSRFKEGRRENRRYEDKENEDGDFLLDKTVQKLNKSQNFKKSSTHHSPMEAIVEGQVPVLTQEKPPKPVTCRRDRSCSIIIGIGNMRVMSPIAGIDKRLNSNGMLMTPEYQRRSCPSFIQTTQ